ncbi:MAG: TonB-dependent receptor [Pseudomonadales bacterium]|jgi:iron complex outermembrane receptor protein|nr:TonB-dependent receptor [Pseudomonadales bacterium]
MRRRGWLRSLCLIALLQVAGAALAEPGGEGRYEFQVSEGALGPALEAIARVAGANVLYPYELAGRTDVNEVSGHLTPDEALAVLLDGTGLTAQMTEGGVIVLTSQTTPSTTGTEIPMQKENGTSRKSLLASIAVLLAGPQAVAAQEAAMAQDDSAYLETVVVTGVRGAPRVITDSPTPIDVFTAEDLQRVPQVGLFESLRYLVPSINLPQRAGGGTATFIASAGLRGLNPDQTLILVNGKRRHKTALINTATGLYSGSAGVDLNMIPNSAIKRIEVLRDGAAAQYGSDAIAGVINIILKDADEGGELTASGRENFDRDDGEILSAGFNQGLSLGEEGFVNLSVDFRESEFSNRARPVPLPGEPGGRNIFPLQGDGSLDPREFTIDRLVTSNYGNFPQNVVSGALNAGYNLGGVELYGFGTYAQRDSVLDFTFRAPGDARNVPEIYPFGYRPREEIREDDYELVLGARGEFMGFDVDASGSYGTNETDWYNTLGLNASLGAASPTSFFLGGIDADEFVLQIDATKRSDLGNAGMLQTSFGAQFRNEGFEIRQGEELSYIDGGNGAPPEAQGFPGFAPEAVNDVDRDNVNGYLELGWEPNEKTFLSLAGRYEDFSDDSGSEFIYKLSGRYEFSERLAVRGSFNTGFRAPSIQQLGFRGSRGQFQDLDDDGIAETIVVRQTLPGTDPAAQALGAEPLVPETSTNLSVGFVLSPIDSVSLTVDFYQIEVDDRIALSSQFNRGDGRAALGGGTIGDEISALLDAAGFDESLGGANYFTNAIDTQTRGVDVVGTWAVSDSWGSLNTSIAYNYNDDEVTSVDPNPPELAGLVLADGSPIEQFDRGRLGTYTRAIPSSKLVLSSVYTFGGWVANLRATQFGAWDNINANPANDTSNDAAWIVDLEAGFEFPNGISIYGGANNLFNDYPDEVRPVNGIGNGFYDTTSPYGFTGGSWYLRGAYRW